MQNKSKVAMGLRVVLAILLLHPKVCCMRSKIRSRIQQAMAENQKRLSQYQWIETTIVSMKGEEKSARRSSVSMDPMARSRSNRSVPRLNSNLQRTEGKVVAKKKEEITGYMKQAVELVHSYVPPDPDAFRLPESRARSLPARGKVPCVSTSMTL